MIVFTGSVVEIRVCVCVCVYERDLKHTYHKAYHLNFFDV